ANLSDAIGVGEVSVSVQAEDGSDTNPGQTPGIVSPLGRRSEPPNLESDSIIDAAEDSPTILYGDFSKVAEGWLNQEDQHPFDKEDKDQSLHAEKNAGDCESWDGINAAPSEDFPAALRGVHITAMNVMHTSSMLLETSGLFDNKENEALQLVDDDGMEEEEMSLSSKAADLLQSFSNISVHDFTADDSLGDDESDNQDPVGRDPVD
ncbi:unnamed protein product, partial [Discosporangium mesarthrocarpum]